MTSIEDSIAVVTGATRGIGRQIALELGRRGAHVVAVGRTSNSSPGPMPGSVEDIVEELGDLGVDALGVQADLTDEAATAAIVDRTLERFGRADIVVNNAAYTSNGPILEVPWHRWQRAFRVQVVAPMQLTHGFAPGMAERGRGIICNIGSTASRTITAGLAVYSTSKLAMDRWSEYLALELDGSGIAVNTLRVDQTVATEGWQYVADTQGLDVALSGLSIDDLMSPRAAAAYALWMLEQPLSWTGHNVGFAELVAHGAPTFEHEFPVQT